MRAHVQRLVAGAQQFAAIAPGCNFTPMTANGPSTTKQVQGLERLALALPLQCLQWNLSGLLGQAFAFLDTIQVDMPVTDPTDETFTAIGGALGAISDDEFVARMQAAILCGAHLTDAQWTPIYDSIIQLLCRAFRDKELIPRIFGIVPLHRHRGGVFARLQIICADTARACMHKWGITLDPHAANVLAELAESAQLHRECKFQNAL
eukprot:209914-Rhodomonas_salina.1